LEFKINIKDYKLKSLLFYMKFPFFRKKPELERHIKKETAHRDLHTPNFLHTQAIHLDLGVFRENGVIPITRLRHSQAFENAYKLVKIGKKVFFNCNNQPPIELKSGTHYVFGNEGLISWNGENREPIATTFFGINTTRISPIESIFFIDEEGAVHIKRFNKGWQDEVKLRMVMKVSENFYKSQAATLAARGIASKLREFGERATLQIVDSASPFNSHNTETKKAALSGAVRKIEGSYNLEINGHHHELKEGCTYVFGRYGLFEINTYTATENNISRFMDTLQTETKKYISAIESIFTIKGGQVYLLSY